MIKIIYKLFFKIAFIPLILISLYNLYFFFSEGVISYILILFVCLIFLRFSSQQVRVNFFESYFFVNIFTALLPPKAPFSGVQFSYFDYLLLPNNYLDSVVYADTFRYIGFHMVSVPLLATDNLMNLNVALFFVNLFVFFGIFNFYKTVSNKQNILFFQSALLSTLFLINLPDDFNFIMGLGKLLVNGTAGFGSYGFRVFSPASFDLLSFIPLTYLLKNKEKKFLISALLISSFHYYLFVLFLVMFITYIHSKTEKSFLTLYLFLTLSVFSLLNRLYVFKYLSDVMISSKEYFTNINLIPVISIGTLFNNGKNNSFIYYFDLDVLEIFKPIHLVDNFSPTLGVYNNLASIPFEKIAYIFVVLYFINKNKNYFLSSFLKYLLTIFLASHILFSKDIYSFQGFIYPWRLIHFASVLSFILLISILKEKIETNNKIYLFSILFIPLSLFLWSNSELNKTDYDENLQTQIELLDEKKILLIPIDETKYLYDYGLPNVYISIFHPIDWFNERLLNIYFLRMDHYYEIFTLDSCIEVNEYIVTNNIKIDFIFFKKTHFDDMNCPNNFKFY